MECTPLHAPFGARLSLDPDAPIDGDALRKCFQEYGLLLVRGQELSAEAQRALLAPLGRIEPNPDGTPMEMEVTNQHDQSTAPEGELVFHSDYAYDPAPITAISMYGLRVEGDVTPTLFTSARQVLAGLPEHLVARLRRLQARHACFLERWGGEGERASPPDPLLARGSEGWGPDHYWATHPAIQRNEAGAEFLFVCLQHTDRFLGIPRDESDALLEQLFACLYDEKAVYAHHWEPHDLVMWDNLAVQHARPTPRPGPRTLRRYHVSPTDLTHDYVEVARELGIM